MSRAPLLACAALILIALVASVPHVEAAKATLDGLVPLGLGGTAAAATPTGVYQFSGRIPDAVCTNQEGRAIPQVRFASDIIRYDPITREGTVVARMPQIGGASGAKEGHVAVATPKGIYIFGGAVLANPGDLNNDGCDEFYVAASTGILRFDPATHTIQVLDQDRLPVPAWGMGAVWTGSRVLLFGGVSITDDDSPRPYRLNTIISFDPEGTAGQRVRVLDTHLPYEVQDPGAALLDGKVYLLGGLATHTQGVAECPPGIQGGQEVPHLAYCPIDTLLRYNPADGRIDVLPERLPTRLQFHSVASIGSDAYVLGGRTIFGQPSASILRLRAATERIEKLVPVIPGPRFGAAAVSDGKDVLLLGGKFNDSTYYRGVVRFNPRATEPYGPEALNVTASPTGAALRWQAPTYDGGAPVSRYLVYRAEGSDRPRHLATTEANQLTYTDATARPGVTYFYGVSAANAAGESASGAGATVTMPTRPSTAPRNLTGYAGNDLAVLRWLPPADNGGLAVDAYRVYRDGELLNELTEFPRGQAEYRDASAHNGQTYTYQVRAVTKLGESPASNNATVTPAPVPPTPVGLSARPEANAINVTWKPAPGVAASGYRIYRAIESGPMICLDEQMGFAYIPGRESDRRCLTLTSPRHLDTAIQAGRRYAYTVTASSPSGESPPTQAASAAVLAPPSAPRALAVEASTTAIKLSWLAPLDAGGALDLNYTIARTAPDGATAAFSSGSATSFVDANATKGVEYVYVVRATNGLEGASTPPLRASLAEGDARPLARLTVSPSEPRPREEVRFDASLSASKVGRVKKYTFDFGDGTPALVSLNPVVRHTYAREGAFTARLVVEDDLGTASAADEVRLVVSATAESIPAQRKPTTSGERLPGSHTPGFAALAALATLGGASLLRRGRK